MLTTPTSGTATFNATTQYATLENGEPGGSSYGSYSVWYKWTAPERGQLSISLAGNGAAMLLTGGEGGLAALTPVSGGSTESPTSFTYSVASGTTYWLKISSYSEQDTGVDWRFVVIPSATSTVFSTHSMATNSSVKLSSSSVLDNQLNLRFDGALDAVAAEDVSRYSVLVNGIVEAVELASYDASTFTVTLALPGSSLQSGNPLQAQWRNVKDVQGRVLLGQANSLSLNRYPFLSDL